MVREQIRPVFHENVVFLADWLLPLHEGDRPGQSELLLREERVNTECVSTFQ